MPGADPIPELKATLVSANRILVHHDIVDGFGHVSARLPDNPERFLLARRKAPGLVTADDIIEFDLSGEPVVEKHAPTFLERFIHSEIYAARPDVNSVVHSHSPLMVAMSVAGQGAFRPVCHTCGFLGEGTPLFEIRKVAGDATNLLISSRELGKALAETLADAGVVLMRGHGTTAVGASVQQAVYRAVYSEINARVQLSAQQMGVPEFLTPAEAKACEGTSSLQVERTWAYWLDLIGQGRASQPGVAG
ncbi:MAG: class II aldolase/adducin family protein [Gammaproteobacteria bacterium]|nr:class II aldolase/adducin family protein [Gammaproteobacteria bacterium]